MDLERVVTDIADVLKIIDSSGVPFKAFRAGVGPYGEPQLVKLVAEQLNRLPHYPLGVKTMRTPDLLIVGSWALEIKIARPFGDNGRLAENWSVNLLHPYGGNTSLLGDCLKLGSHPCQEQKAVLVIGYEHDPPQVSLEPLTRSFEVIATQVLSIQLGDRVAAVRTDLIHPVHQRLVVIGWTVDWLKSG
jgi:hypothetical protein